MIVHNEATEAEIRSLVDDRIRAVREKDVDGVTNRLAPDIVVFDVINPLRYLGASAVRRRVEEWFSSFRGPLGFEMLDVVVETSGDVAYSHSLNGVTGTTMDGKHVAMWWRATMCYRRVEGRWVITHEHNSVPFDPRTGKASIELRP